jgi:DNA adenine methylase
VIHWTGSKHWQVPFIAPLYPRTSRFVELFAGGAAMTFGLRPERALLNDLNPEIINLYRQVKLGTVVDLSGPTNETMYYQLRAELNQRERWDGPRAAGLFYYLNAAGFNHLCRYNASGEFNVPFRQSITRVEPLDVATWQERLWNVGLTNEDFRNVIFEDDDFVYADPPYLNTYNGYTAEGFSFTDLEELLDLGRWPGGRWVITNSYDVKTIELARDLGYFVSFLKSAQAWHQSRGRTDVVGELLITNFKVSW